MGSTRNTRRTKARNQRRPDLEALEVRNLLSATPSLSGVALPASSTVNADGTTNFDAIVGASAARSQYKVDGSGLTVAVIDGGVDYHHEALGGALGAGHKVIAGYDFANNTTDPFNPTMDHGTAVAGLIASSDPAHPGIAPGADIVALRVFDNNNQGDFNRVADALQWVIDHHDQYNISAVNISLSDGNNYTHNWFASDGGVGQRITTLIGKLDALNIPVMSATGNSYSGQQGQGFTSIIADTISVTSTDSSDHIVSNAQRLGSTLGGASATDIAAPGDSLNAPLVNDAFGPIGGTSFSTPIVTGSVVLMQELYKQRFGQLPTVAQLDTWLHQGSDPVSDPATGLIIGRLDIPKTLALIPTPAGQVITPPGTTTPPPVTTPPPPVTTPPPVAVTTDKLTVWVDGQSFNNADLLNPGGKISSLPTWFQQALQALKNWWAADATPGTDAGVWVAASPGSTQPAGYQVSHARAASSRVHRAPTAPVIPATVTTPHTTGMPTPAGPHLKVPAGVRSHLRHAVFARHAGR
jgi:subtilisin family serine protease